MSHDPFGEVNPFEAPRAGIGEEVVYRDLADNDAELIRREHIGHEANVKSIGHLYYLGAFFGALGAVVYVLLASGVMPVPPNQRNGMDPAIFRVAMGVAAAVCLVMTVLFAAPGYGLTKLQSWARWMSVVITSLALALTALYTLFISAFISPAGGLIFLAIIGGINGAILWILVAPKAGVVFSADYKEVIRKTPHVRLQTSLIVKILLVVLIVAIGFVVAAAIFSGR